MKAMEKNPHHNQSETTGERPAEEHIDGSRRRIATAGLAAVVLMTVANRPVMGAPAQGCTLSAWMSAGSGPAVVCSGRSWEFWKTNATAWPEPYKAGTCEENPGVGTCTKYNSDGTQFLRVFEHTPPGAKFGDSTTMMQVLFLKESKDPYHLGAEVVAALLNAAASDIPFGYTVGEIINLYENNRFNAEALAATLNTLNTRVA